MFCADVRKGPQEGCLLLTLGISTLYVWKYLLQEENFSFTFFLKGTMKNVPLNQLNKVGQFN